MTSAFIKDLKSARELFNKQKDYNELQGSLQAFVKQFDLGGESEEEEESEIKSYAPEDLELVCYMTLS